MTIKLGELATCILWEDLKDYEIRGEERGGPYRNFEFTEFINNSDKVVDIVEFNRTKKQIIVENVDYVSMLVKNIIK